MSPVPTKCDYADICVRHRIQNILVTVFSFLYEIDPEIDQPQFHAAPPSSLNWLLLIYMLALSIDDGL